MGLRQRPQQYGLYDPQFEHENCGVGFVAHIKGQAQRKIVTDAQELLIRMTHRGAVGAEKTTGDGAGILVGTPHSFFKRIAKEELDLDLPPAGSYSAGIVFLPQDVELQEKCKTFVETSLLSQGLIFLGWRPVPRDNSMIGPSALSAEPAMVQLFVGAPEGLESGDFDRALFVARKFAANTLRGNEEYDPEHFFYIASLSSGIVVYKGMLMPEQLFHYFHDLQAEDFSSHLAMVHSRFSTNTFPSWDRAQPLRFMSHNGEINTLRGNMNKMKSREGILESDLFGPTLPQSFPINQPDQSDSGNFDNVLELLILAGFALPEAIMMMIPEAWQRDSTMSQEKREMYEYFSNKMEPWDGPASVAFTDGTFIGAVLDRNGLRPSRFYITDDDVVIMASEVGVVDVAPEKILKKGRLQPGKMFLVNFKEGRIVDDEELKNTYSQSRPYGRWLTEHRVTLDQLWTPKEVPGLHKESIIPRLKMFGYTLEHLREILKPMAELGKEPLGSMGNDAPLAVLSDNPRMIYDYFKQLFAQVTNPPIDSIRESIIMSLKTYIGPEHNLLTATPEHAHRLLLEQPVLTNSQLAKLKTLEHRGWKSKIIDTTYLSQKGYMGMKQALDRICQESHKAIKDGFSLIILSDRNAGEQRIPLSALLATGAVHHHLVQHHERTQIGIIVESGEPREVHHFCTLVGYGADGINPYLAFESMWMMKDQGIMDPQIENQKIEQDYLKAIEYGMLKVFGKMGISTLESYKGSQIFEALGLASEVIGKCFVGTPSRIEGAGFAALAEEAYRRHQLAYPKGNKPIGNDYLNPGDYSYRHNAEKHMWDPESIANLQIAVRQNSRQHFKLFSDHQNQRSQNQFTLRGLLKFSESTPIPLDDVEPVESIMKRFVTGAMSFGSISQQAHEALAIAMNRIGGKSNTGEGGELSERYKPLPNGDSKRSAIKQVASGRFGVTIEYLVNADEIQIKMAQGAKPGEGGELPGHKVFDIIAKTRHSTPGVGLISPPPHHDIYSIEDLAQLIFDLKNANPRARISVKLVSEVGVGTIAAGVAKAHADHILISGHDGGTGASPLTGIKHAGLPWELGLAETHQTLVMNDLRSRVVLQTDGQLKTGRDVVIAALLGAEEFGVATGALVSVGCIMMRKCQKNTCPVGVATQDEKLRAKFSGRPEHVVNFIRFIAEEARDLMAKLGFKTIDDMVGRVDLLQTDEEVLSWKSKGVDLGRLLVVPRKDLAPTGTICCIPQDHGIEKILDRKLIKASQKAIKDLTPVSLDLPIRNTDRAVGTMLSSEISRIHGFVGLPPQTIRVKFTGHAGQTFGGWLSTGVDFQLEGDTNDYIGKGLSGGTLTVYPPKSAKFQAEKNIIIGNVAFYGAIQGRAFIRGQAAERFCVRNSGAEVVVEGVGDHGCEYMTGGRVVVLGETGKNFAAGMSGGIAYVWNVNGNFLDRLNTDMVEAQGLTKDSDKMYLRTMVEEHVQRTGSSVGQFILDNWKTEYMKFFKVISPIYERIVETDTLEEVLHG